MFKMENKKIDSSPLVPSPPSSSSDPPAGGTTILKPGKKGMFRIIATTHPPKQGTEGQTPRKNSTNSTKYDNLELQLLNTTPLNSPRSTPSRKNNNNNNNKNNNVGSTPQKGNTSSRRLDKQASQRKSHLSTGRGDGGEEEGFTRLTDGGGRSTPLFDSVSLIAMDDNAPQIALTWIGRKVNVTNVKKSLKILITAMETKLPPGDFYSCVENFDTYLTGGLYPALHLTSDKKVINKLLTSKEFISTSVLGDENMVEQAVYTEVASVRPPGNKDVDKSVLSVAAFRNMEDTTPEILIKEWKNWTGTRAFMVDILQAGLSCKNVKFYVKKEPKSDPSSFFYVVVIEVGMSAPSDEGLFIDILQRFRVERFLGYRTIYRRFNMTDN